MSDAKPGAEEIVRTIDLVKEFRMGEERVQVLKYRAVIVFLAVLAGTLSFFLGPEWRMLFFCHIPNRERPICGNWRRFRIEGPIGEWVIRQVCGVGNERQAARAVEVIVDFKRAHAGSGNRIFRVLIKDDAFDRRGGGDLLLGGHNLQCDYERQ